MATVLVVDDHPDARYYLSRLLDHSGHRALEAVNGAEALKIAHAERPDLVISDILMPEMDGYEFVHRLRQDEGCAHTPVIFCSAAYEEGEVRPLAEQYGVSNFLRKPATPASVFDVVEAALGRDSATPDRIPSEQVFDREHSRVLLMKLDQKVKELESTNQQLLTLLELGQQLTATEDVPVLLERFCHGACEIVGAQYAAVCILGDDQESTSQFFIVSNAAEPERGVQPPSLKGELLARLLTEARPVRQQYTNTTGANLGLSPQDAGVRAFLGTPIRSSGGVYGLLYLLNKLGADEFSTEDEALVATLASQIAVAHENARRQEFLRKELAERRQAVESVRRLNAELETRVEERTADLKRSNSDLEQFAYVASHDLQEPLRKIAGFSQLLAQLYKGKLDAEADEFIGYITDGVSRMQTLIHDLLAFSRAGRRPIESATIDSEAVLATAIQNLQGAIEESGALITHDPLPTLRADKGQLVELFQNLIGNAIKYHSAERPAVHVSSERSAEAWTFSVRDNGIGIAPEFFERIFVVFQRLHTRQEYPGTGIGLAICKKIVERHGGRIWLESNPGSGTTFHFTIPAPAQPQKDEP